MGQSSHSGSKNAFAESSSYVQGAAWSAPEIADHSTRGEAAILKPKHVKTLLNASKAKKAGVLDDSSDLQEKIIKLLADLPADSRKRDELNNRVKDKYWDTLAHPTIATYGDKSKYRQADGSYNNLQTPDIGKAETPYGRTGRPQGVQNVALPDPGDIFDMLFARHESKDHPNKLSSFFFSVATVITHDFFSTDRRNPEYNQTSHYVDLSPLYGNKLEEQVEMRTYVGGRIKPDCFASKRILALPPAAGILLVMFNRLHNHVVTQLAAINENGRFTPPDSDAPAEEWKKYDEDLFQTGRLIACAYYVNVVVYDYIRTILSIDRTTSDFVIDPREYKTSEITKHKAPAQGNVVTVEFNLAYRWHGGISVSDERWIEGNYQRLFNKRAEDVGWHELVSRLQSIEDDLDPNPAKREFGGLVKQGDRYDDDDLVAVVTSAIENVAHELGANSVPKSMRAVEILGIMQARRWNVCTLNEFREALRLKKYETFEDINPDPTVARHLKALYGSVDLVELYPGMIVEKTKAQSIPGQGLCCGYTTATALISDGVGSVRSDRFYTTDYTPANLTNWGYAFSKGETSVDSGHILYKLFLTAFPNHFEHNSVYAHFPFITPSEERNIQTSRGQEGNYSWNRPYKGMRPLVITSYWTASDLISDTRRFQPSSNGLLTRKSIKGKFQAPVFNNVPVTTSSTGTVTLYGNQSAHKHISDYMKHTAWSLIAQNSVQIVRERQVDIQSVANMVLTHFVSDLFGIPQALYDVKELHRILMMASLKSPTGSPEMCQAGTAQSMLEQVAETLVNRVKGISKPKLAPPGARKRAPEDPYEIRSYGEQLIHACLVQGLSEHDIVWTQILPTAADLVTDLSTSFALALEYYMGEGVEYAEEVFRAARLETPEGDDKLFRFILEANRINGRLAVVRDAVTSSTIQVDEGEINILQGTRVVIDTVEASMDPEFFPDPSQVRLDRAMNTYLLFSKNYFSHYMLDNKTIQSILVSLFRSAASLPGLKPAKGPMGELKKVMSQYGYYEYLTPDWSTKIHFPTTLTVRYESQSPALLAYPDHGFEDHDGSRAPSSLGYPEMQPSESKPFLDYHDDADAEWKGGMKINLIVLTLCVLSATTALDAGIFVTSLPTIATAVNSTASSGFWIGTSYLLVAAALMPFIGSLSDVLGRRPVFIGVVLFLTAGSIVGGLAHSTAQLLAGRILQGIGSAGVQPLTHIILCDLVPLRLRPKYLAGVHISFAVGLAISALLGGVFAQHASWRWIFYINLPFCGVGLVMIALFMKMEQTNKTSLFKKLASQVDWVGGILFTGSITSMLIALTWGGVNFSWSSAATLAPLILGVFGLFCTWVWEKWYAAYPFIRFAIFNERSAVAGYIATVLFGIVAYSQNYFIGFFTLSVKELTPTRAGVVLLPFAVAVMPVSIPVNIIISRTGRVRWALWTGWILQLVFSGLLLLFTRDSSEGQISGISFLGGALQGFLFPSLAFVPQAMAKNTDESYAATMFIFFRALGMCLGVAVGSTVFQNTLNTHLLAAGFTGSEASTLSSDALLFISKIHESADPSMVDRVLSAVQQSFHDVCYVNLALVVVGLLISFTIKKPNLNHKLESSHIVRTRPKNIEKV